MLADKKAEKAAQHERAKAREYHSTRPLHTISARSLYNPHTI